MLVKKVNYVIFIINLINYLEFIKIKGGVVDAVEAIWDQATIITDNEFLTNNTSNNLSVNVLNKNVYMDVASNDAYSISIYNAQGQLCWNKKSSANTHAHSWQPTSTGMYVAQLKSTKGIQIKKFFVAQ